MIPPFSQTCYCQDNDTVMAVYVISNLGSNDKDWSDEANTATQITDQLAQKATAMYLQALKEALEALASDSTGIFFLGDAIDDIGRIFWSKVVDFIEGLVDTFFAEVFGTALQFVLGEIAGILGHPNCNGEVLHGFVMFLPNQADNANFSKVYEGPQENDACGTAPHTLLEVSLTQIPTPTTNVLRSDLWKEAIA